MSDNTLGLSDIAEGACEFPFLEAMYDNPRIGFRALPVRAVLVFYWDVIGGLAFGFARCGLSGMLCFYLRGFWSLAFGFAGCMT